MIVFLCVTKYDAKHLEVSKNIKLSKVQGFIFVSKIICYKPCTTNQKQNLKKKKKNKEMENKQRETNLVKKYYKPKRSKVKSQK
jgi:hypothetical protein